MNQSAEADGGLGARLDRLMRAAEKESAQVRDAAERRAAALLTEAGVSASTSPPTRQAILGPAGSQPAAAIGRRRGDLRRARLSGLSAAPTDQADDPRPS
jgi:hypothetical protein